MLQFITHRTDTRDETAGALAALQGGCRWIQLRMKEADDETVMAVGKVLRRLCDDYGATLILDDRVHLVEPLRADGVHLGKNDMAPSEARRILPAGAVIGATANTADDALRAVDEGAYYIGLGPFRFTSTKKNLSPVLGCDGLREVMTRLRSRSDIPVVAIGGIVEADIPAVLATGVSGVALSGVIQNADDPVAVTRAIIEKMKQLKV